MKIEKEHKLFLNKTILNMNSSANIKFLELVKTKEIDNFSVSQKDEFQTHLGLFSDTNNSKSKNYKIAISFFEKLFKDLPYTTKITIAKKNGNLYHLLNFDLNTFLEKKNHSLSDLEFLYYLPLSHQENKILLAKIKELYKNDEIDFSLDSPYLRTWLYLAENGVKLNLSISRIHHRKMDDDEITYNLKLFWRLCIVLNIPIEIMFKLFENYLVSFEDDYDYINDTVVDLFENLFNNIPGNNSDTFVDYFKEWNKLFLKFYTVGKHTWDPKREFNNFNELYFYIKNNEDSLNFTTWWNIIHFFTKHNFNSTDKLDLQNVLNEVITKNKLKNIEIDFKSENALKKHSLSILGASVNAQDKEKIFNKIYDNDNFWSKKSNINKIGVSLVIGIEALFSKFDNKKNDYVRYNSFIASLYIIILSIK